MRFLQMSKRSFKTTLGDLQGDQSEIRLSKSPSFIVGQEEYSINGVPCGCA
jgi:hypothetical protein